MPIVYNHSRGPLEGYAALGYRKRQQEIEAAQLAQAQAQGYGPAQQQMASIRGDMARLGQKQKREGRDLTDTYAGFAFNEPTTPTLDATQANDIATAKGAYGQEKAAKAEAENVRLQNKIAADQHAHELEKISLKEMARKSEKTLLDQQKLDKEAADAESSVKALGAVADTYGADTDFEALGFTPREQRRLHELQDGLQKLRTNPTFSAKEKAIAMKQMVDEINSIKPTEKKTKAFTYETDAQGNVWQTQADTGQRTVIHQPHPPKEEKPEFTNGDIRNMYRDAEKSLTKTDKEGNTILPSDAEVEKKVDVMMERLKSRAPRAEKPAPAPAPEPQPHGLTVYAPPPQQGGLTVYPPDPAQQPAGSVQLADPQQQMKARQFIKDAKAKGMAPEQIRAEFNRMFGGV